MPGHISEVSYTAAAGQDFIEISVPAGTDVSSYMVAVYLENGNLMFSAPLGTLVSTVAGQDVYVLDEATAPGFAGLNASSGIALIDDAGATEQFISFDGTPITATNGPASGETSTDVGSAGPGSSLESNRDGTSYSTQSSPNPGTVHCYAPGTLIDTPEGPRAVETLRPGDLVLTVDHGAQPIRWVRSGDHPLDGVEDDRKPVLIQAGALGSGLPEQDLIVSPQHRILVGGGGQLTAYFKTEVFVPAKSLTSLPGIRYMKGKRAITWIHAACDRHEVLLANGCQSESLLLGPMVTGGLGFYERQALIYIFGAANTPDAALNGPPARDCLTVGEVRRQLKGQAKKACQRRAREIQKWDEDTAMEQHEAEMLREAELVEDARKRRVM